MKKNTSVFSDAEKKDFLAKAMISIAPTVAQLRAIDAMAKGLDKIISEGPTPKLLKSLLHDMNVSPSEVAEISYRNALFLFNELEKNLSNEKKPTTQRNSRRK